MSRILLNNVRLSFPSVFKKATFEGKETKYEATLLIPKSDTETYKKLKARIEKCMADAKIKKLPADKVCLKDGDDSEYDGYEGNWSLKAANNKRPNILDRDKSQLTEEDEKIYAGCRVNAVVDFWYQNNAYGKRINCNLYGIQFLAHDEPFGQGAVDVTDDFDNIENDDDEFYSDF